MAAGFCHDDADADADADADKHISNTFTAKRPKTNLHHHHRPPPRIQCSPPAPPAPPLPSLLLKLVMVLLSSMAMVMGPTPPGTGVIAPAVANASADTSPTVLFPEIFSVTRQTSHVTRHTPHVTRHTSHATRHTSHVTRHTSHVTRHRVHIPVFLEASGMLLMPTSMTTAPGLIHDA
jgi:hypothetical protein